MLIDRLFRFLSALLALPLAYLAMAFLLGLIPIGSRGQPGDEGIEIFLMSNGWHADLVLPMRTNDHDWQREFGPADFPGADPQARWIAFGWGDRAFYLETARIADMRFSTALAAFLGLGPAVLHVTYLRPPRPASSTVRLVIDRDQHRRLAAYLTEALERDVQGRPITAANSGYGPADAFYAAKGAWGPRLTCNEWIARGLRQAGIRAPFWAPLPETMLAAWR